MIIFGISFLSQIFKSNFGSQFRLLFANFMLALLSNASPGSASLKIGSCDNDAALIIISAISKIEYVFPVPILKNQY